MQCAEPGPETRVIDCTFGRGGYSEAFLKTGATVTAFDRDPSAKPYAEALRDSYGEAFAFFHARFSQIDAYCADQSADAIIFDIGVSSPQLDEGERGFSFMRDGPLDMRMGLSNLTAADLVNTEKETDLANLLYQYGDETRSRKIATAICKRRKTEPFTRTEDLAAFIKQVAPSSNYKIHPATKTFQALRIAVNEELKELETALQAALNLLKPDGRLIVVTFHSLEDAIVKKLFKDLTFEEKISKYAPIPPDYQRAPFEAITKKPLPPSDTEIRYNPRARSAKLRAIKKR